MKQIFATFVFLLGMICSMPAQDVPKSLLVTQPDSATVASDTIDTAYEARIDSIVQAKVNKQLNKEMKKWEQRYGTKKNVSFNIPAKTQAVAIIATILSFVSPLLIIGMILYYRYKNKKERYEVKKQELAHGKNLPPEFCNNEIIASTANSNDDILWRKGIKTFFLGLGLALFLGILTDESELSSIGLLIMCIGGGEITLSWFPSVSQTKKLCHKYRKEEKLWNEQSDFPHYNAVPQPETRQTAQDHPSDRTPQQKVMATEGVDKNGNTEANLPGTKDNLNSEEKETSCTDKEEIKG